MRRKPTIVRYKKDSINGSLLKEVSKSDEIPLQDMNDIMEKGRFILVALKD